MGRVRDRSLAWLKRRAYLDPRAAEERSNDAPEPSALEACTQLALAGGALMKRPARAKPDDGDERFGDKRKRRFSASLDDDDEAREASCATAAVPPSRSSAPRSSARTASRTR